MTHDETLSPPQALLVLASRVRLGPGDAERMDRLLSRGLDWHGLLEDAHQLGVLPLLHRHVGRAERASRIPPEVRDRLASSYRRSAMRSLRTFAQLQELLRRVSGDGGPPIVLLKGASLAETVYGDIALRPMQDLDILCRPADLEPIRRTLLSMGYHQKPYKSRLHETFRDHLSRHVPPFTHPRRTKIEVHLSLFGETGPGAGGMDRVWLATEPMAQGRGNGARRLGPEDQILHLVHHLHEHLVYAQPMLYWFCDIHETLGLLAGRVDGGSLVERARTLGVETGLEPILRLLRDHWGTPVPDEVMRFPGSTSALPPLAEMLERAGEEAERRRKRLKRYGRFLRGLGRVDGFPSRIRLLFRALFPPPVWIAQRYGAGDPLRIGVRTLLHPLRIGKRALESGLAQAALLVERRRAASRANRGKP